MDEVKNIDNEDKPIQEKVALPEAAPSKSTNKKVYFIGGIIVVIIVLLAFMYLKNKNAAMQPTAAPMKTANTMKTVPMVHRVPTAFPLVNYSIPASWYTLKTQFYQVNVPSGWKPVAQPFQGGVAVSISPSNAPEAPLLVIENYEIPIDMTRKIAIFEITGLVKKAVALNGQQPVELTGTWGTRTINGNTIKTPTQERIIFIPHNGSGVVLKLYYSSPVPQPVYDKMLDAVLSTFIINS